MRKLSISLCVLLSLGCAAARAQQLTFKSPVAYTAQKIPLAMVTADFNGDGNLDLAIANASSESVSVMLGVGDGTFRPAVNYLVSPGCAVNFLYAADFNKDGHADILAACTTGTKLVFLPGKGDGTFATAEFTTLPLPAFTGDVVLGGNVQPAVADFNGDGILDVVMPLAVLNTSTLSTANAYLLLGKGDGTFQTPQAMVIFANLEAVSFATADFNGDGKPDIAALVIDNSSEVQGRLLVALGQGDGTFHAASTYGVTTGFDMVAGDVNGDGKADLVISGGQLNSNPVAASVAVYLGNGDGSFKTPTTYAYPANSIVFGLTLADVQGSGKLDIVEALWSGLGSDLSSASTSVVVLPSNGDGTFQSPVTVESLGQTALPWVVAGDFNNDGRTDLAFPTFPVNALSGLVTSTDLNYLTEAILTGLSSFPAGTVDVVISTTLPTTFSDANAASFVRGAQAQDSIVAAFGGGLASQIATTGSTLGTSLGGVTVTVKDSTGVSRQAELFYVSPKQINYAMPAGTATGSATVTITNGLNSATSTQQIVSVVPGIFTVNGIAAANVVTYENGVQTLFADAFQVSSTGAVTTAPIDLGTGSQQVYLELYGTGIRHATAVTANLGSLTGVPVAFAPQGQFTGEDQVNILLPQSLKGAGTITVSITADGQTSNAVQVQIQ